jgi:uncharacterized protein (UPF0548 family)
MMYPAMSHVGRVRPNAIPGVSRSTRTHGFAAMSRCAEVTRRPVRVQDDRVVPVSLLESAAAGLLMRQPFTYAEVGQTRAAPPLNFQSFTRSAILRVGVDFDTAARDLFGWQVQARAGLRVAASALNVEPAAVVVMRLGIGPLALRIPCRVVYVIDEPDRQGFAYGTLPGHPESGEEAFVLHREAGNRVRFVITAFSRPATRLAKLGAPVSRQLQHFMTSRYLQTVDR